MVLGQDIAYKQQPQPLPLWLGGIERGEDVRCHIGGNAMTIVSNGETLLIDRQDNETIPLNALDSILDNVDQHLLEEGSVEMNGVGFFSGFNLQLDVANLA